jgi:hypothetical protein
MRAGYGEKLRKYLSSEVDTESVLDFGMAQNFGAATTYTCITRFYRQKPDDRIRSCYVTDDRAAMADPEEYFEANAVVQKDLSALPWVILSPERHAIKKQVEAQGIPLEKWDIQINYGIKTGFNDAFYLTQEQRDAFVAQDPNCAKYLVPLLRGRYVSRYATDWDGTWMINSHNGVKSKSIPPVDLQRECPVLWQHVSQYEKQLSKRQDKGDHWSNLRNCAYVEEFEKPKIIIQEIAVTLPFFYDPLGEIYMDTTCFMITSDKEQLPYLAAFMNTQLFRFCFRDNFPEYSGNACRMKKIFLDRIPVKKPSTAEAELFAKLVPLVQAAKKAKLSTAGTFLETLIDACVMECYFREHMAERDLLFQDTVATQLAEFTPISDVSPEAIEGIVTRLQATELPAKLKALPEKSPDLLAVILKEGKV